MICWAALGPIDGNFFKKKDVAIVGGGEESVDDALYLANICNKVYFIINFFI